MPTQVVSMQANIDIRYYKLIVLPFRFFSVLVAFIISHSDCPSPLLLVCNESMRMIAVVKFLNFDSLFLLAVANQ